MVRNRSWPAVSLQQMGGGARMSTVLQAVTRETAEQWDGNDGSGCGCGVCIHMHMCVCGCGYGYGYGCGCGWMCVLAWVNVRLRVRACVCNVHIWREQGWMVIAVTIRGNVPNLQLNLLAIFQLNRSDLEVDP